MKKQPAKNKPNRTGRSQNSRIARLDHSLLNFNAYRALSPNARALLFEMTMLDNGSINGGLYPSVRDAGDRIGIVDLTAVRNAFSELKDLGFIEMTEDAHFHVKSADKSRARCWRPTWLAGPGRKGPTLAYATRQPEPGTKAHMRRERGLRALKTLRKARDSGKLPVLDSETKNP